jgi:DNA (cytosine-5)-methyltransferase 1
MKEKLIAIDLFAGCGGLSQGLAKAGFDVRVAVEIDAPAAQSYRKNHPNTTMIERDIREVEASEIKSACGSEPIALLAGCAPCQGFCSLTSKNTKRDPRNGLVLQMAKLIRELKPTAVMMENVPGLEKHGVRTFNRFLRMLRAAGYWPRWEVVQMADYGVPQSRRRLVLFAGRGFTISFPKPTHARSPKKNSKLERWLTLRDVIANQPKPITMSKARKKGGPKKFKWHVVRDLQPQVAARLDAAIPGKTWLELEESIRPECHRSGYEGFTNTYGRMSWRQTPVTMTGGCTTPCKGRFGHPNKKSRTTISVREAALIQTFPRGYKFETDFMDVVCDMIGNAVPPKFARVAGKRIREELEKRHESLARSK